MDIVSVFVWGVIMIAAVIIELATVQFVSIWFAFASLVTLISAGIGAPIWAQLLVFAAVSVILLILTRPLVARLKGNVVRTNVDLNIGKTAVVTEDIKNELSKGRATIGGVSWIAVSEDGSPISAGETVAVKEIDGAKLIVSKIN